MHIQVNKIKSIGLSYSGLGDFEKVKHISSLERNPAKPLEYGSIDDVVCLLIAVTQSPVQGRSVATNRPRM